MQGPDCTHRPLLLANKTAELATLLQAATWPKSCRLHVWLSGIAALQVAKNSQVIMIAVKPQYVGTVLEEIKDILTDEHIIVSIAAGVPLSAMKVSPSPSCELAAGVPVGREGAPQGASNSGA